MRTKQDIKADYMASPEKGTTFGKIRLLVRYLKNGHSIDELPGLSPQFATIAKDCARFTEASTIPVQSRHVWTTWQLWKLAGKSFYQRECHLCHQKEQV